MKSLEEMKQWYIDAVKAQLILNFAMLEADADRAVISYGLRDKLEADPKGQLENSIEGVAEDIARKNFIGRPCSLLYKGYTAEISYDSVLKHLYGKIEGISQFISFETELSEDIEAAFHKAVDDYLSYCEDRGIVPETGMNDAFAGDKEAEHNWRVRHGIRDTVGKTQQTADPDMEKFSQVVTQIKAAGADIAKNQSDEEEQNASQASDIDLLRSFGIDPDEVSLDVNDTDQSIPETDKTDYSKQIDIRTGISRDDLQNMESEDFLRLMGIDPDDVIL